MIATSQKLYVFAAALFLTATLPLPAHAAWGHKDKKEEVAGAILFRDKGCAHCHGADRAGTQKAPSLVNIRKKSVWTVDKMTDQILNGGKKMPPFSDSLSDQEAAQIVAYLRAKHPPSPPPPDNTSAAN